MKIRPLPHLPRLPVALRLQPHRNTPPLPLTLDIPARLLLHHLLKIATLRDHHESRIPQIIVDTFLAPERPLERPKTPWKNYFLMISLPAKGNLTGSTHSLAKWNGNWLLGFRELICPLSSLTNFLNFVMYVIATRFLLPVSLTDKADNVPSSVFQFWQ